MALRTSKPAFNLREKVSELDRPVGNHGAQLMRSESPEKSFELVRAGRKNLLINGSCQIAQRDTLSVSNSNASVQYGGPDRWLQYFYTSGEQARYDFKQTSVGDSLSERGFKSAMHLDVTTADTSIAADHSLWTAQRIEGFNCDHLRWGTDHAKDLTLSFWIKSSVAGYYSVVLAIDNNGDNRYITTYQVDKKDTWEYKVIHFPGHKSVNIDHDNSTGLEIKFTWMAGSNRIADPNAWNNQGNKYGATGVDLANIFSSTSNNLYLTGVQLEEGNTATPFDHRLYAEELALCKRYYEKFLLKGIVSGGYSTSSGGYGDHLLSVAYSVEKRTTPTFTYDSVTNYQPGGGSGTPSNLFSHTKVLNIKTGSQNSNWQPQVINSNAYAYVDAEL